MAVPLPQKILFPLPVLSVVHAPCAFAAPASIPVPSLYKKLCADCHGANGEGVKDKYDDKLVGELSLDALARKIDRTMPEDKEHLCVGEEAKQVAALRLQGVLFAGSAGTRAIRPRRI
jgi:hypothetical protein